MSELRTYSISGVGGTYVNFPTGVSNLEGPPKVLYFDPKPQSTDTSINASQIKIVFDQEIQFSGISTIYLREGSASGSIVDSFDVNSSRRSIAKNILTLEPLILEFNTTYYLTIPSDIIRNPQGSYYSGTTDYFFTTHNLNSEGGDASFKVEDNTSPTGYYQYHVFTSSGILTTSTPSYSIPKVDFMLVGGGGGGASATVPSPSVGGGGGAGGLLTFDEIDLPAGNHTITIGSGGAGETRGTDSTISTPLCTYTAFGGGGCLSANQPNNPTVEFGGSGGGKVGLGYTNQGNPGGLTPNSGGGGAGTAGDVPALTYGGDGRLVVGFSSSLLGPYAAPLSTTEIGLGYYAGGGAASGGLGGIGGGGDAIPATSAGSPGDANTGGGGGGSSRNTGGSGGSGVFIIRFSVPANY